MDKVCRINIFTLTPLLFASLFQKLMDIGMNKTKLLHVPCCFSHYI
jgi:hypothetical protein